MSPQNRKINSKADPCNKQKMTVKQQVYSTELEHRNGQRSEHGGCYLAGISGVARRRRGCMARDYAEVEQGWLAEELFRIWATFHCQAVPHLMKSTLQEVFLGDTFEIRSKGASVLKNGWKGSGTQSWWKKVAWQSSWASSTPVSQQKTLIVERDTGRPRVSDYKIVDEICQGFRWLAGQNNQQYSKSKWSL